MYHLLEAVTVWFMVSVVASFIGAMVYPVHKKAIQGSSAPNQAFSLLIYGLMPLLVSTFVVCLLSFPEVGTGLIPNHCHDDACAPHIPVISSVSPTGEGIAIAALATLIALVLIFYGRMSDANKRLYALRQLSAEHSNNFYRVIESPALLAWCTGVFRQQIYISRGLINRLSPEQLEAVLMHEFVHVLRKDNLRKALLQFSTILWPGAARKQLLKDLSGYTERACQAIASRECADPHIFEDIARIIDKQNPPAFGVSRTAPKLSANSQNTQPILFMGNLSMSMLGWLLISILGLAQVVTLTGFTHIGMEWLLK